MSGALKGFLGKVLAWAAATRNPGNSGTRPNSPAALMRGVRRVVLTQGALTLLVAVGFGVAVGWSEAVAALYGGGVAVAISGWQGWRLKRLGRGAGAAADMAMLYVGMVQRYAAVFVLLGLGLAVWRLVPLPLITAFAVAQLGYWVRVS